MSSSSILWFDRTSMKDIQLVGGKNASLGEMIQKLSKKVSVPMGFATTTEAFYTFLKENQLIEKIDILLKELDVSNISELKRKGSRIRRWIRSAKFSTHFKKEVEQALNHLKKRSGKKDLTVAVRSSATAEDLSDASFAGQQETFLNVSGLGNLLAAIREVFASLYNDRAISYRQLHGFHGKRVAISVGVQEMVRSDLASSGVMFSIDTESGFDRVVFITGSWGLGEMVVQGAVNPDEYIVYKPALEKKKRAILRKKMGEKALYMVYRGSRKNKIFVKKLKTPLSKRKEFVLNDKEIEELARYAVIIEQHYGSPMDIEWAKDGINKKLYIVQARPETVKSQVSKLLFSRYQMVKHGKILVEGRSIGQKIGKGRARVLKSLKEIGKVEEGDVLVTDMTDPDWEPIMKKSSAIVTNRGGRTCHAAIVARELGIPAVVGCGHATKLIGDSQNVTVSCAEGDTGYIYEGLADFKISDINVKKMPKLPLKMMMNIGDPDQVFSLASIPNHGVGLARLEFVISNIGLHPNAALDFKKLPASLKKKIAEKVSGYKNPVDFYVNKIEESVATIAAAFYPKPVIVRTSDFKSNEYANLLGGKFYEPKEGNPMIGFRGSSRYVSTSFKACFELECRALKAVRDEMGLTNVEVMIPFVRTVEEGKGVIKLMEEFGLKKGENGLRIIMMCEIPSNAILADQFLKYFDGFSIGSNDLTQLTLGLDRDSSLIANLFDERDDSVKFFLERAIRACNSRKKYIGICGQGPSDHPDLAQWLLSKKIGSLSLNPDTLLSTWLYLAKQINRKNTKIKNKKKK